MKKILYWCSFFILFGLLDYSVAEINDKDINLKNPKNNFIQSNKFKGFKKNYQKKSYIDLSIYEKNKNLFEIPSKLNIFLKEFIVSIQNEDSDIIEKRLSVTIKSNAQKQIGSKLIVEGNVVIRSTNGILKTSKFTYDQKNKYMLIEGDIFFRTKSQYLTATRIEYDFINKKGFIDNAFGSINFKKVSELNNMEDKNDFSDNFENIVKS